MIYALDGHAPELRAGAWAAPSADLIGKVLLEEAANVWFGAVLRGDNEVLVVGRGSNVQDNAVLHTDMGVSMVIGENCTIGGNVWITKSIPKNSIVYHDSEIKLKAPDFIIAALGSYK